MKLAPTLVLLLLAQPACDSPSATGPAAIAPDARDVHDAADLLDGTPADTTADTSPTPDTETADTTPVDTAPPSVCELGCIPVSTATAPRNVTFQQFPSGPPPALGGGPGMSGDWHLTAIEVRPNQTFADGIDVQIANAGQTAGRAAFGGDAVAMALDLHLAVTVTVLGSSGSDTARQEVALGGCHTLEGARVIGSLASCASGFPAGTAPPSTLDYEHDPAQGRLALGLSLSREALIALLPEDQRDSAELAVTGPLYLIARFARAAQAP